MDITFGKGKRCAKVIKKRLIRIFDGQKDLTMAYLHKGSLGEDMVDGIPRKIFVTDPMPLQSLNDPSQSLTLVLSQGIEDKTNLISFSNGEVILRLTEDDEAEIFKGGFLSLSSEYEEWFPISLGVITVSDRRSRGELIDTSGPALENLARSIGAICQEYKIVPDDIDEIRRVVCDWCDKKSLNLILLTGGTGISQRDVTPEALLPLSDKIVYGIGEYMRWSTSLSNPMSILSRGIAISRGKTLLVALPGSERGAIECFSAVSFSLRHAVEVLTDRHVHH